MFQNNRTGVSGRGRWPGWRRAQPGQAILLIALLMVVLLGFIGLAIDGGILYKMQRDARNAADAATMAAIYRLCTNGDSAAVQSAGLAAASANGFDNDGVTNRVTITNPPGSGPAAGNPQYVEVTVWADSPTYLIQLVYPGPTEVTARAVGHCRPQQPALPGYALLALAAQNPSKTGLTVSGGGNITITNAGAFSNSTNTTNGSITVSGDNTNFTADGSIDAVGTIAVNGVGATFGPTYSTGNLPMEDPLADLPEPENPGNCQNVPPIHNGDDVALPPGCYTGVQMNGGTLTLSGGIYYFTGDVTITNGDFIATDVMIFLASDGFQMTGGELVLTAMSPATNPVWAGMAMYSSRSNTGENDSIKLTAQSSTTLIGTIYAPGVDVELSAHTGDTVIGQIIADVVMVSGQGDFYITYDPDLLFQLPPSLEINE